MPELVLTIPNNSAGEAALQHLRGRGGELLGGTYRQSLSDLVRETRASRALAGLRETFHLFAVPECGELEAIQRILRFHSFPENGPPPHGHVTGAEINVRFSLSAQLGTPMTFDQQNHSLYRTILNVDAAVNDGITGNGVRVAVVDSGAKGIAVRDFFDVPNPNNQHPGAAASLDYHGHGTAMATIIRDVAPGASIYAVRIADQDSVLLWEVMAGTAVAVEDCAAEVVNLSLGLPDLGLPTCPWCGSQAHVRSLAFEKLLLSLAGKNPNRAIYVAATGNDGISTGFDYPAAYLDTLAIGSVNSRKQRSSFSNYGSTHHPRYLMATGGEIDPYTKQVTEPVGSGPYASVAGTSAAAAYASGVLALLKEQQRYKSLDRKDFLAEVLQHHCHLPPQSSANEYGAGIIFYDSQPKAVTALDMALDHDVTALPLARFKNQPRRCGASGGFSRRIRATDSVAGSARGRGRNCAPGGRTRRGRYPGGGLPA